MEVGEILESDSAQGMDWNVGRYIASSVRSTDLSTIRVGHIDLRGKRWINNRAKKHSPKENAPGYKVCP